MQPARPYWRDQFLEPFHIRVRLLQAVEFLPGRHHIHEVVLVVITDGAQGGECLRRNEFTQAVEFVDQEDDPHVETVAHLDKGAFQ